MRRALGRGQLLYDPLMVDDEEARRRRLIAFVGIGLVVVIFVVMLVALATDNTLVAGLMFLALIVGWFAVRSFTRQDRA